MFRRPLHAFRRGSIQTPKQLAGGLSFEIVASARRVGDIGVEVFAGDLEAQQSDAETLSQGWIFQSREDSIEDDGIGR